MNRFIGAIGVGVFVAAGSAWAAAPAYVPVQGFLANADGSAVDGDTIIAASVFTTDTGGTAIWSETQTVTVDQGAFTMYLGDVAALDLSIFKDNEFLYLQFTIGTDAPMSRFQLATTPFAGFAQYAGDSETLGGMGPTDFASATHGHAWSELTGVPADLADGDDDTTYSAGAGLTLAGTTFSADTTALQSRVTGTCAAGSSIRVIDAAGTVTCQTDTDTTYSAGTGLTLAGTTFNVDTTALQARVTGTCAAGSSIRVIDAAGAVTCEADDDTVTTYSAGSGLTLAGTTFSVNTAAIQARVAGTCAAGSSIRVIDAAGAVTCEADDGTTYSAGTGLTLSGTTFNVNTAAIQARVAGTCAAGSSIRVIDAAGAVTCEADDNTTYSAGGGLTLAGTTFSIPAGGVTRAMLANCTEGQTLRFTGGAWACTSENRSISLPVGASWSPGLRIADIPGYAYVENDAGGSGNVRIVSTVGSNIYYNVQIANNAHVTGVTNTAVNVGVPGVRDRLIIHIDRWNYIGDQSLFIGAREDCCLAGVQIRVSN